MSNEGVVRQQQEFVGKESKALKDVLDNVRKAEYRLEKQQQRLEEEQQALDNFAQGAGGANGNMTKGME